MNTLLQTQLSINILSEPAFQINSLIIFILSNFAGAFVELISIQNV
jgi:hypothetical protein